MKTAPKTAEKLPLKKKINWALPDQNITQAELLSEIKKAEESSFMTIDEFEERFEKWKHKKGL